MLKKQAKYDVGSDGRGHIGHIDGHKRGETVRTEKDEGKKRN